MNAGASELADMALARDLIARLCEQRLDADGASTLMRLVRDEPAVRRAFVNTLSLHADLYLQASFLSPREMGESVDGPAGRPGQPGTSLYDAMILPALHDLDQGESRAPAPALKPLPMASPRRPRWVAGPRWSVVVITAAAAAAAVAAAVSVPTLWPPPNPPAPARVQQQAPFGVVPPATPVPQVPPAVQRPAAVVSATAATVIRGAGTTVPGTPITAGQSVELARGAVELTFDSGAVVVVSAPATFCVLDGGHLALDAGSVTAHVPPSAVGFRVGSPDLSVVDRGTDFGIRARGDRTGSLLSVFKGAVDAAVVADHSPATAPTERPAMRVTAGRSVSHEVADRSSLREVKFEPATFVRSIDGYRMPLALHGTGDGVPLESVDPNWSLVAEPDGVPGVVRPAYVVALPQDRFSRGTAGAQWISTAATPTDVPGGNYTFRTTAVMPDVAPRALSMMAVWAADDWITDILVNGASTAKANQGVVGATVGRMSRLQSLSWDLSGAPWRVGDNQVEVVVWNKPGVTGEHNRVALKLEWRASVRPAVRR